MSFSKVAIVSFVFLVSLANGSSGQSPKSPVGPPERSVSPDPTAILGSLDGRTYRNHVLKFSITVPDGMVILNQSDFDVLTEATRQAVDEKGRDGGKSFSDGAAFEKALSNTIPLLVVGLKPLGSEKNAAFEVVAIRQNGRVEARAVMDATVRTMESTGSFKLIKQLDSLEVGGRDFVGVEMENSAFAAPFRQRSYFAVQDKFAIAITIAYHSEQQLLEFDPLFKTFSFAERH